ncbi:MAG: hypothetical protein ACU0CI_06355 [Shimia sp.]
MSPTAQFRMIPISRRIHYPKWGPFANHDVPLKGAVSGTLTYTVRARTPLGIGTEKINGVSRQFRPYENGPLAIPKSSMDGLVRAILEVVTFGRLGDFVDVRWPGMRDISPRPGQTVTSLYGDRLVESDKISKPKQPSRFRFKSRVKAGWLRKTQTGAEIVPCKVGRVEIEDLRQRYEYAATTPGVEHPLARGGNTGPERQALLAGCNRWQDYDRLMHLRVDTPAARAHRHADGNEYFEVRHSIVANGGTLGSVVMTGKPKVPRTKRDRTTGERVPVGPYDKGYKKREFVFSAPARTQAGGKTAYPVKSEVLEAFLYLNKKDGEAKRHPSWTFWQDAYDAEEFIPVFYIGPENDPEALGMAQMFKLPFGLSPHDLLERSHPDHVDPPSAERRPDFPSALMGEAAIFDEQTGARGGRASRITFGMARAPKTVKPMEQSLALLAPNEGYYNAYVRQDAFIDPQVGTMATYVDQPKAKDAFVQRPELAGTKAYPARADTPAQADARLPNGRGARNDGQAVKTQFECIPAETELTGTLAFHNVLPEELGAVVWALTKSPSDEPAILRLGRGKPFGLGQITVQLKDLVFSVPPERPCSLNDLRQVFEDYMTSQTAAMEDGVAWKETKQVVGLLEMREAWRPEQLQQMDIRGYATERHAQKYLEPAGASGHEFSRHEPEPGRLPSGNVTPAAPIERAFDEPPPIGTRVQIPGSDRVGTVISAPRRQGKVQVELDGDPQIRSVKWQYLRRAPDGA